MGTERDEVFKSTCFCGKGSFSVVLCSPDHMWATSSQFSYELSIKCTDCNKTYDLVEQEGQAVIVERTEITKRVKIQEQWHLTNKEIMKRADVIEVLQNFVVFLESLGSIAAIHRFLSKSHLGLHSLGTFRKKWAGAKAWVSQNVRPSNLPTVMEALGKFNEAVSEEVEKSQKLWVDGFNTPLPIVGTPIYKIGD
jgi:hypothetical protein